MTEAETIFAEYRKERGQHGHEKGTALSIVGGRRGMYRVEVMRIVRAEEYRQLADDDISRDFAGREI